MIVVHDVEQGTDEWHALRADRYTGSNAHKLLKYGAISYALTSTGTFGGNFYTERGHILEVEAVELYEAIYDRTIQRPGFVTNSLYAACGYSPDGIDGDLVNTGATLLEIKCFNKDRHKTIAKGEIPVEIMAQIQFGMVICNIRKARLILYNPDFAKKTIVIDGQDVPNPDYDPELALVIIEVKYNRNIHSNFKRILKEASNALHTQTAHA